MTILYINNEHCTSIAQLKGYFAEPLSTNSPIFYDLLECGRYGDIAQWLREVGEVSMANRVESINSALSDSEYINQLGEAITGEIVINCTKPTFANCVNLGYLDKMGDENLLKGSYWTFRVITSIIWASPDDGSSA